MEPTRVVIYDMKTAHPRYVWTGKPVGAGMVLALVNDKGKFAEITYQRVENPRWGRPLLIGEMGHDDMEQLDAVPTQNLPPEFHRIP